MHSNSFFDLLLKEIKRAEGQKAILPMRVKNILQVFGSLVDDDNERKLLLTITVLISYGAMMLHVSCWINENEEIYPYLFLITIGDAAIGKSILKIGNRIYSYHASLIAKESQVEVEESKIAIKKWKDCISKCKEEDCGCGVEPTLVKKKNLLISASISYSKLISNLFDNQPESMLLFDTELDNASHTDKQDFGNLSPTLRKIFENEPVSTHTHTHGNITVENPKMACIMSGTEKQIMRFLGNKEDGFVSRCIYFLLRFSHYKGIADFDDSKANILQDTWKLIYKQVETASMYFRKHHLQLTMDKEVRLLIDEYFSHKEQEVLPYNSSAYLACTRRMRGILIRIMMIIEALHACEDNFQGTTWPIPVETARFVLGMANFLLEQSFQICDILPDVKESAEDSKERLQKELMDKLPCDFSFGDGLQLAQEILKCSESTFKRLLRKWIERGLLEKSAHNQYHKVNCKEEASFEAETNPYMAFGTNSMYDEDDDDDLPF